MSELIYKDEAFKIVGCCMEIQRELGKGHDEVIYKDALEIEFQSKEFSSRASRNSHCLTKALFCRTNISPTL